MIIINLFLFIILHYSPKPATSTSSSSSQTVLPQGSSLFVENKNQLLSPNRIFTAGFHQIGKNAYCFAIWFSENNQLVWIANRDEPVNGKRSQLSLSKTGNVVLMDAGRKSWTTNTTSDQPLQLQLLDSGNLVLTYVQKLPNQSYIWESFSFPTDTILPNQPFTKNTVLKSSRSLTNFSSGFYKLYFDNDNIIRLMFDNDEINSVYWPRPWLKAWETGRSTDNNTRFAILNPIGNFTSSDQFTFRTSDSGETVPRRLTLDTDGNVRVYTLKNKNWVVSYQVFSSACSIHGVCGQNSLCTYSSRSGRRCSCVHGYKMKDKSDSSLGCEPTFDLSGDIQHYDFIKLPHVEFYGFDSAYRPRYTLEQCKNTCLRDFNCKAFQFTFNEEMGSFICYIKSLLISGVLGTPFNTYLKLPKKDVSSYSYKVANQFNKLECSSSVIELKEPARSTDPPRFILWFSVVVGGVEAACFLFFYFVTKEPSRTTTKINQLAIATGFKRFTFDEITKASNKFRDEIGRGGGGIVYKGTLSDNRVVAIKRLHEAVHGEAEFLAEMSTIGRINHRNLIETYGYCAEGKHRILVYKYMEKGSLAGVLGANQLDWKKRFEIAVGVAKGLAYLHEECLEWVLHCDVKPHNILLDGDYNPKVADFGLSKFFNQDLTGNSVFSKIRGTRGYMAPEWVSNLPITSKVDVYSYGMVILEMITGRTPGYHERDDEETVEQKRLVSWVREKVHDGSEGSSEKEIMEILNPMMNDAYGDEIRKLFKVALQCVKEDRDARPTMTEVVKTLLESGMDD